MRSKQSRMDDFLEGLKTFDAGVPDSSEFIAIDPPNRKGQSQSKETRQLISRAQTGKSNSFYGKKHTKETRDKMSKNHADVCGTNNPMMGVKHSPEAREKMRQAWIKRKEMKSKTV